MIYIRRRLRLQWRRANGRCSSPFLARTSEVVLPFYILHQTVILTIGWFVVRWAIPDLARWAIIAVVSLAATVAGCELIRRVSVLRVLFGMKPRRG